MTEPTTPRIAKSAWTTPMLQHLDITMTQVENSPGAKGDGGGTPSSAS